MATNPLQQIDAALKPTVLDLWAAVHELIDQSGESGMFNFWQLVPDHEKASCEEIAALAAVAKEHNFSARALEEKLYPAQHRQEVAVTRLYLAIGFVLGLRLSGASEERIKCLMNTYSFGLSELK